MLGERGLARYIGGNINDIADIATIMLIFLHHAHVLSGQFPPPWTSYGCNIARPPRVQYLSTSTLKTLKPQSPLRDPELHPPSRFF